MPFAIDSKPHPKAGGPDPTVYTLGDSAAGCVAEVWPAMGFNCYRWSVERLGKPVELLYQSPELFPFGRPTRSGIPVLFPYPNRVRGGTFVWDGKTYQLPLTDSTGLHSIHGFACRKPWRVIDQGATDEAAWLTGEFHGSVDAPEWSACWPADYQLRLTYRLRRESLRIEAEVLNPDKKPLPFGLGYHPYFAMPFSPGVALEDCSVEVPAASYWKLAESLPTGEVLPVDAARDLNKARRFPDVTVDDVLTGLPDAAIDGEGLRTRATLHGAPGVALQVLCSEAFRELVVFTPPHRQAFCVEPYSCPTDAANLESRGIRAGWQVLAPGGHWTAVVELRV